MKTIKTITAAAMMATLVVSNAYAGGFLADVVDLSDVVDKLYSPEADCVLDGFNHSCVLKPRPPEHVPQVLRPPQQTRMGNFCITPLGDRFGPGPINVVGAFCWAMTSNAGVVVGTVGP